MFLSFHHHRWLLNIPHLCQANTRYLTWMLFPRHTMLQASLLWTAIVKTHYWLNLFPGLFSFTKTNILEFLLCPRDLTNYICIAIYEISFYTMNVWFSLGNVTKASAWHQTLHANHWRNFSIPCICYERNFNEFFFCVKKSINLLPKASVVCSVTTALFIVFCLNKLNVFPANILLKNEYLNSITELFCMANL